MRSTSKRNEMTEDYFAQMLHLAKRGDGVAVGEIWSAFNPKLLRYLRVVSASDWEDIASEAWIGVAKALPTFRGDCRAFESLMFTIARRRVVDHVRRFASRPDLTTLVGDRSEDALGPEEMAVARDSYIELMDRLQLLPPSQREVILLRVISGLDVAEIAEIVEKSPGAVRVLSHRGLMALLEMENSQAAQRAVTSEIVREGARSR